MFAYNGKISKKRTTLGRYGGCMPLIPAEPGVHTEFKFSLGCVQDPVSNSLKTSQMRKKKMVLNSGLDTAQFTR